jgi:probable nitrogen fixation protein
MRAQDTYDAWEGRSDASILGDFIVTKEQRKEIPIIGDPDPDVLWLLAWVSEHIRTTIWK